MKGDIVCIVYVDMIILAIFNLENTNKEIHGLGTQTKD